MQTLANPIRITDVLDTLQHKGMMLAVALINIRKLPPN